ncbi:MAG: sulfatase-like hydrolase/transferase, partial [Lachnospirales bacterium]
CGPARACLQTGKYATQTNCFRNAIALSKDEDTIAKYVENGGYDTAYIGKWHLASTDTKQDYATTAIPLEYRGGWSNYWMAADVLEFTSTSKGGYLFNENNEKVNFNKYRPDALTDFAIDYIDNKRDKDKPFFLFISYLEPHHQNTSNKFEGPEYSEEKYGEFVPPKDLKEGRGDWQESYADYLGCCNSLDNNLNRILKKLEEENLRDDTLIIFTSDHGCHFKTRNSEYKRSCHENSIRIPLVINGPKFKGGKVIKDLVSLMDIPPTFLNAANIDIPKAMVGNPLQNLLENPENWKKEIFIQISESQVGRAIRTKKWKYSVRALNKDGWIDKDSKLYFEDFLYDLESDPFEERNLVREKEYENI